MAVFPDRIVLKNSTDAQAAIETAIASGGTDPIVQGEIVLGLSAGTVQIYTLDSAGNVVSFSPASVSGRAIVSDTAPTVNGNGQPLVEGDLWFEPDTGSYYVYYTSSSTGIQTLDIGSISTSTPFAASQTTVGVTIVGGSGAGAAADVSTDGSGNVTGVTVKASGSGYIAGETVTLDEISGTGIATIDILTVGTSGWIQASGGGGGGGATALNDLIDVRVPSPSAGQVLTWNASWNEWWALDPDPMTADGDMIRRVAGSSDRLPIGIEGEILKVSGGLPAWGPAPEGGGGRGDGGDFDTGTVGVPFVMGVYGGGDFNAGSAATTAVAPFAHAYIDSNNISSTTAHTGMSSAAHVYVASTDSYIDFTFDTAQPNTDYSVLHSGEAGWNVLEVESKTTTGFRVSFYDEATGNPLTTGAVGIGAPVITVYASNPSIAVDSSAGVDLPVELLNGDEGPDAGVF